MNSYILETPYLMTGKILELIPGQSEIDLLGMTLKPFKNQPNTGYMYIVSQRIKAKDGLSALKVSEELFAKLEDSLSFYYSMPVIWQYWQRLLRREDSELAHLSVCRYKPGVAIRDHGELNEKIIEDISRISREDPKFANCIFLFNALARIDTVELSRAQLPVLFSLVDSIADREVVKGCDHCGKKEYTRTSSAAIRKILGKELHTELYYKESSDGDGVRNAVMHGNISSKALEDISLSIVGKVIVKLRSYLAKELELMGLKAITDEVVDPVRYLNIMEGIQLGIMPKEGWTIENYIEEFKHNRIHGNGHNLPDGW